MFKRRRVIIILGIVFAVALSFCAFLRRQYVVPIIMYHSVEKTPQPENRIRVSAATFERQMRFLRQRHYNVISLEALGNLIREKRKIPPRTIAITFDDGYRDNFIYAFPILKKYNFPATIFIIVNEVGRQQEDRLSWEEIKIMQDSGLITIGSHCLGPEPLINIKSEKDLRKEIFDSKKILEEKLGRKVDIFSYPGGMFNQHIRQLVIDAGYKIAVGTNPGKDYPDDDIFVLKRLRISENAENLFVFAVETSGYYTFMKENKRKHAR
ncbi:MAG: polysaccharide deacetylase family protein [Candidatus Omnitrophica bacterium]|nr:polysaccharide deacetylase family protein [Candidatus Omnitrophota bacterium]